MPHETDADRIVRERMRQREAAQREQERIAKEAAVHQLEADRQHFLDELKEKVSAILNLQQQTKDYGAEAVEVVVKVPIFGPCFRREARIGAGWFICRWSRCYEAGKPSDPGVATDRYRLYLLSDGSLCVTMRGNTSEHPYPHFDLDDHLSAEQLWKLLYRYGVYAYWSDYDTRPVDRNIAPSIVLTGLDDLHARLTNALQYRSQQP